MEKTENKERIAKRLAHAGIASRREVERMILDGRVKVNGVKLTTPAHLVGESDIIVVDGNVVGEKPATRLWRFHKPAGLVTTANDPQGRPTVFEGLPKEMGRVISVGRLDLNSEGLLLLTNDGELARHMELPATGWIRRYRVRVNGVVDKAALKELENGITVDGVRYAGMTAEMIEDKQDRANVWLEVALKEGKNREIRRVMEALGLSVNRLLRTAYGPFQLGSLPRGAIEEVTKKIMREQFGKILKS